MAACLTRTVTVDADRWGRLTPEVRTALLRSDLYRAIGWAFLYPSEDVLDQLRCTVGNVAGRAAELQSHVATIDALRAVADFSGEPVRLEHDRVFGHTISAECPPYETCYGAGIIFAQAHQLGDIAAFYRAFGVDISDDAHERADHISAELEFMSILAFREAVALLDGQPDQLAELRDAERKFLLEHVAPWALSFAERLGRKARGVVSPEGGFYAALSSCLDALLRDELRVFAVNRDSINDLEPVRVDFDPEGGSFACGPTGEPVLAGLPGFTV